MNLSKREFLQVLGASAAAGLALGRFAHADAAGAQRGLYDTAPFGNVSFLHMTDCPYAMSGVTVLPTCGSSCRAIGQRMTCDGVGRRKAHLRTTPRTNRGRR
jgi:hypothetical protein